MRPSRALQTMASRKSAGASLSRPTESPVTTPAHARPDRSKIHWVGAVASSAVVMQRSASRRATHAASKSGQSSDPSQGPASVDTQPRAGSQASSAPHIASSPTSKHAPSRQRAKPHEAAGAAQSASTEHEGGGQRSGVSGVHAGSTHAPSRHALSAGSPAGQTTPAQSRVMRTVTALAPPCTRRRTSRAAKARPDAPMRRTVRACSPAASPSSSASRIPSRRSAPASIGSSRSTVSPGPESVSETRRTSVCAP